VAKKIAEHFTFQYQDKLWKPAISAREFKTFDQGIVKKVEINLQISCSHCKMPILLLYSESEYTRKKSFFCSSLYSKPLHDVTTLTCTCNYKYVPSRGKMLEKESCNNGKLKCSLL
jgi:hypothetical protein